MSYRDSYTQYHHLPYSHYVLYQEWLHDEPVPTPDQLPVRDLTTVNDVTTNLNNGQANHAGDLAAGAGSVGAAIVPSTQISSKYWDVFNDDEDWAIFNRAHLTVECNGNMVYNEPVSHTKVRHRKRKGRQGFTGIDDLNGDDDGDLVYVNSDIDGSMDLSHGSQSSVSSNSSRRGPDYDDGDVAMETADAGRTREDATVNNEGREDDDDDDDDDEDEDEDDVIIGSLFDPRTLARIKQRINGWENSLPRYIERR